MEQFKRATAIYTGGGIYLYYAELDNGNWVFGDSYSLMVLNVNPLADDATFEMSMFEEWQREHLVKEIPEEEYQSTLNLLLDVIFKGNTIKEHDNFCKEELLKQYTA